MKIKLTELSAMAAPTLSPLIQYAALLALTALLNPYTLFGRDSGIYWASAFLVPIGFACLSCLARSVRRSARNHSELVSSFIRWSLIVQVLVLSFQWADA